MAEETRLSLDTPLVRLLMLPIIPIVFAYLELGGNWFAYRLLERPAWTMLAGMVLFGMAYALVAAGIARHLRIDLALLMVNYGFGFSIVSLLLRLEWGRLPALSFDLVKANPALWSLFVIALIGFIFSAWFVLASKPVD